MKTLRWLWWTALIIICFRAISAVIGFANGVYSFDVESFGVMVILFALISGILIVFWIMGRTKEALAGKLSKRKGLLVIAEEIDRRRDGMSLKLEKILKNGPLSATEHFKVGIFLLLLIPSIFPLMVGIGIIPVLFLAFGYYMMKKNNEFSSVEASVKAVNIYLMLAAILWILFAVFIGTQFLLLLIPTGFYFLVVKYLYFKPLQNHSEWVVINGTFSNKPKKSTPDNLKVRVDILQSEKLKPYSVADELLKWAKLKEGGLISEEEFNEARSKLLNRS